MRAIRDAFAFANCNFAWVQEYRFAPWTFAFSRPDVSPRPPGRGWASSRNEISSRLTVPFGLAPGKQWPELNASGSRSPNELLSATKLALFPGASANIAPSQIGWSSEERIDENRYSWTVAAWRFETSASTRRAFNFNRAVNDCMLFNSCGFELSESLRSLKCLPMG